MDIMNNCPCRHTCINREVVNCSICKKMQHKDCMKDSIKMFNYECPSCQIGASDLYLKTLCNIMTPTLLPYGSKDPLRVSFGVRKDLDKSILEANLVPNNNSKFLIMRCLRLDQNGFEHHWPMNSTILMNNKVLKILSHPRDVNRSTQRKDFPIIFYFRDEDFTENYHKFQTSQMFKWTDYLQLHRTNQLEVRNETLKNSKDVWSYVVSIDLVEVLKDVEDVIKTIPFINDVEILKKRQLTICSMRNELQIVNERVSFLDNYLTTGKRIHLTARSYNCHHLKVFDLKNFLLIRRNKSYDCPFCKTKATRIYVDGAIYYYMNKYPHLDSISISGDYTVKEENEINKINSNVNNSMNQNSKNYNNEDIIELLEDEDEHIDINKINYLHDTENKKIYSNKNIIVKQEFVEKNKNLNMNNNKASYINKKGWNVDFINLIDDEEDNENINEINNINYNDNIHKNRKIVENISKTIPSISNNYYNTNNFQRLFNNNQNNSNEYSNIISSLNYLNNISTPNQNIKVIETAQRMTTNTYDSNNNIENKDSSNFISPRNYYQKAPRKNAPKNNINEELYSMYDLTSTEEENNNNIPTIRKRTRISHKNFNRSSMTKEELITITDDAKKCNVMFAQFYSRINTLHFKDFFDFLSKKSKR